MAKKKKPTNEEMAKYGVAPNEKPMTPEEKEKQRLLNLGKVYHGKGKN